MRGALLLGFLCLVVTSGGHAQDAFHLRLGRGHGRQASRPSPTRKPPSIEGDMRRLGYDQYRALRTRPDTALWRDGKSLFRAEFFPAGFIYEKPVEIFVVEDGDGATGRDRAPTSSTSPTPGLKQPPQKLALAGFKLTFPLNRPGQVRRGGLLPGRQLLPADRPRPGLRQLGARARDRHRDRQARRNSPPSARSGWSSPPTNATDDDGVGAARFARRVRRLRLHHPSRQRAPWSTPRPCCSCATTYRCWASRRSPRCTSPARRRRARDDYRPEIHDSDGLYHADRQGRADLAAAATIPGALAVSAFQDSNPRGFGLLQRERDFDRYQDSGASLQARPSLWVEPIGDWGDGEVRLLEIPSQSETNDNIAAFWVSRWPAKQGRAQGIRLSAVRADRRARRCRRPAASSPTRAGAVPYAPKQRRVVVEFAGGELPSLRAANNPSSPTFR